MMNPIPLYASKRTAKSLWQEYRIYRDRLELQSWFLIHTLVVPANEIQAVEIRPSGIIWGVKLDNCNFCRHVLLIKNPACSNASGSRRATRTSSSKFANPSCRTGETQPVILSNDLTKTKIHQLKTMKNPLFALFIVAIVLLALWDGVWKVIAMWKSARNNQLAWFICLAIFNTAGILPILYILLFQNTTTQEPARA